MDLLWKLNEKWSLLILTKIERSKKRGVNFNQLKRELKPISPTVLSLKLQKLENMGYIRRRIILGRPIQVKYYSVDKVSI